MTKRRGIGMIALGAVLAAACVGTLFLSFMGDLHGNLPYRDNRSQAVDRPVISVNDAVPVPDQPKMITVYDSSGKLKPLKLAKQPVMFFWYDCGYCQRTFAAWEKDMPYPVLVSMGFAPGTPLSVAKRLTQDDLTAHHVPPTVQVYYRLSPVRFVPGYPMLTYPDPTTGQLMALRGMHSPAVWKTLMIGGRFNDAAIH